MDLLSHRAKVQPYTGGQTYQELPKFRRSKSERRKQFAKYLLKEEPVISSKPYNYSNAGYSIAALMLEKVSGKTWELMTKELLKIHLNVAVQFAWPNK